MNIKLNSEQITAIDIILRKAETKIMQVTNANIVITMDITPNVLSPSSTNNLILELIMNEVCEFYSIRLYDLQSASREKQLTNAREMVVQIARELSQAKITYKEIGTALGGRDHATMLHSLKQFRDHVETEIDFKNDYQNLKKIIISKLKNI